MSPGAILIDLLGSVLLLAFLLAALALFSPVVLTIDSESWEVRVRWLVALEYWRRLAGGDDVEVLPLREQRRGCLIGEHGILPAVRLVKLALWPAGVIEEVRGNGL
jgi:hypothetical protein